MLGLTDWTIGRSKENRGTLEPSARYLDVSGNRDSGFRTLDQEITHGNEIASVLKVVLFGIVRAPTGGLGDGGMAGALQASQERFGGCPAKLLAKTEVLFCGRDFVLVRSLNASNSSASSFTTICRSVALI